MVGSTETTVATIVAIVVTGSLPFYLYGAWFILSSEVVTWNRLITHLAYVGIGLAMTTIPVLFWMLPRLAQQLSGLMALHAFLGVQAYAMLTFGLTGIVRIFQAKRAHDLYRDPNQDIPIDEIHEHMGAWRRRLRVGVFGYVLFWVLAWVVGLARYLIRYGSPF